jgi:large subunit ribosomal protein L14e
LSAKKKRATLSDFDRFKVMVAKKQRSSIIAKKMKELSA